MRVIHLYMYVCICICMVYTYTHKYIYLQKSISFYPQRLFYRQKCSVKKIRKLKHTKNITKLMNTKLQL